MNVLVTGGSGFVASFALERLASLNHNCVAVDRHGRGNVVALELINWRGIDLHEDMRFDAIIHLAAIPRPDGVSANDLFANNVASTLNVLSFAAKYQIPKIVCASSEAVLGVAYSGETSRIGRIPIDEQHKTDYSDPYSASKVACEQLCDSFAMRESLSITTLRFAWILSPETYEQKLAKARASRQYAASKLFSYLGAPDAAVACSLALNDLRAGHRAFFIAASDNIIDVRNSELIPEHFSNATISPEFGTGYESLISTRRAREELGFIPKWSWRKA